METLGRRYERFRADSTTLYSSFFVHTHLLQRVVCFSDVSVIAIAAVAYLKTVSTVGEIHVAFVITIKLALHPARAVPHLELCTTVSATEMADFIQEEMNIDIHSISLLKETQQTMELQLL